MLIRTPEEFLTKLKPGDQFWYYASRLGEPPVLQNEAITIDNFGLGVDFEGEEKDVLYYRDRDGQDRLLFVSFLFDYGLTVATTETSAFTHHPHERRRWETDPSLVARIQEDQKLLQQLRAS